MKIVLEASAGTGKTYAITTIAAAALGGVGVGAAAGGAAVGGPGAGVLSDPAFRKVLARGALAPSSILLTTYTEAATRELKGRIRARIGDLARRLRGAGGESDDELLVWWRSLAVTTPLSGIAFRLTAALADIDRLVVSTIHGYCRSVMRERAFDTAVPFEHLEAAEDDLLADQLFMSWWAREVAQSAENLATLEAAEVKGKALRELASRAAGARGLPRAILPPTGAESLVTSLLERVDHEWADASQRRGVLSFQDQLIVVRDALRRNDRLIKAIRDTTRLALVDEAQDSDPIQAEIFERLFGDSSEHLLILVGDPKQSIYGFRGADLDSYLAARRNATLLRLDVNRRSAPAVVEAVNRIFGGQNPFLLDSIEHPPVAADATARHGVYLAGAAAGERDAAAITLHIPEQDERSAAEWTADELLWRFSSGATISTPGKPLRALRWSDFAVLASAHSVLKMIQRELRARGVPSVRRSDANVFASRAARSLLRTLDALASPGRRRSLLSFLGGALLSLSPEGISSVAEQPALLAEWQERLAEWNSLLERRGVLAAMESMLAGAIPGSGESIMAHALALPGGAQLVVDTLHLGELLHQELGRRADASMAREALARLICGADEKTTRPGDPRRSRLENDADAVVLMTLHNAKGLEFGIVLLPEASAAAAPTQGRKDASLLVPAPLVQAADSRFGVPVGAAQSTVFVPMCVAEDGDVLQKRRSTEEAMRRLYVALTRARHRCVLRAPPTKAAAPSALALACGGGGVAAPWQSLADVRASIAAVLGRRGRISMPDGELIRVLACDATQTASPPPILDEAASHPGLRDPVLRPMRLRRDTSFTRLAERESESESTIDPLGSVTGIRGDERVNSFAPAGAATAAGAAAARAPDHLAAEEPAVMSRVILPGGAVTGQIVHRVLEWAAAEGGGADLAELARYAVHDAGCDGSIEPAAVARIVSAIRTADLGAAGGPQITLASLAPTQTISEMSFCLPFGTRRGVAPHRLSSLFAQASAGSMAARYAPAAARLLFHTIEGFLRGQIDLLFVHDRRWWIVDYKTNDLGSDGGDFAADSLQDAMIRDHYVLQYHLYAVAARRLLRMRGVDTQSDWLGGAIYLYGRGIDAAAPGRGVFVDHPQTALLDLIERECSTGREDPESQP